MPGRGDAAPVGQQVAAAEAVEHAEQGGALSAALLHELAPALSEQLTLLLEAGDHPPHDLLLPHGHLPHDLLLAYGHVAEEGA
jgi:hypothetical protein